MKTIRKSLCKAHFLSLLYVKIKVVPFKLENSCLSYLLLASLKTKILVHELFTFVVFIILSRVHGSGFLFLFFQKSASASVEHSWTVHNKVKARQNPTFFPFLSKRSNIKSRLNYGAKCAAPSIWWWNMLRTARTRPQRRSHERNILFWKFLSLATI